MQSGPGFYHSPPTPPPIEDKSVSRRQKTERGFGHGVISQKQGGNTHPESKGMSVLPNEEEHSEEVI